jgi:hypothetical protein
VLFGRVDMAGLIGLATGCLVAVAVAFIYLGTATAESNVPYEVSSAQSVIVASFPPLVTVSFRKLLPLSSQLVLQAIEIYNFRMLP